MGTWRDPACLSDYVVPMPSSPLTRPIVQSYDRGTSSIIRKYMTLTCSNEPWCFLVPHILYHHDHPFLPTGASSHHGYSILSKAFTTDSRRQTHSSLGVDPPPIYISPVSCDDTVFPLGTMVFPGSAQPTAQ